MISKYIDTIGSTHGLIDLMWLYINKLYYNNLLRHPDPD